MSPTLRPATSEALTGFRRRRSKLLWIKSGCVALGVLLGVLLLLALLDRVIIMPDALRQGLGYAAYAGSMAAAWLAGLRFLRLARQPEGAARLLEQADPSLREQLLSAVELSRGKDQALAGSEEFRGRLQDDVAAKLDGFKASKLLPSRLLKRVFLGLSSIVAVVAILFCIPPLHLRGFMTRAALPFANLARPSSTIIHLIAPATPDSLAAIASSVPFSVQIEGRPAKRVVIEAIGADTRPQRIELLSAGSGRYEGAVSVAQENVRYRIFAGDAVTAWHTLEARPRPRATEFTKTIVPPAYSGLPGKTIAEEQGDMAALEGSTVKLQVKTNEPVNRAAATIFPSTSTLPVTIDASGSLRTEFIVDGRSDSWQLALTAKETGFTNDEASPWRIETIPDLPPTAAITEPHEQIEVRSDDTIQIKGEASDDIGLAKIELSFAINGADWTSTTVTEKSGKEAKIATTLKLAPLPVKAGDAVLVKLVATDLKNQIADSQPLRLLIVDAKLNLAKREWAAKQRQLAAEAEALAVHTRSLHKDAERAKAAARG
ncbi:MAG TPA: Ig-like domain-containing protein, partial [Verrucomicrobiaceae bacterium]